ncbi:MAG: hypothetical protein GX758_04100 [Tenericutes bacterium]|nr:hypothetical protein [Mycoplasmatota bacterium]
MNENYDDQELIAQEAQRNKSGVLQGIDQISSRVQERGLYGEKQKTPKGLNGLQDDKMGKKDKADIDAINNRGTNNRNDNGSLKKSKKEDGEGKSSSSDLDDKKDSSGLKDKAKEEGKDKAKGEVKDKVKDEAKDKAKEQVVEGAAGKSTFVLKVKIIFWAIVISAGLLLAFVFIMYFIYAINSLTTAITSFFGVSESGSGDNGDGGLYTDQYYHLDDNNEPLDLEGLITKLNSDSKCNVDSGWYKFWDDIEGAFSNGSFSSTCQLLRYIRNNIKDYEEIYNVTLDKGLVISTIFYGYDQQAPYNAYDDPSLSGFIQPSEHYKVLEDIISDGLIVRKDIDRIIQNTIFEEVYPRFVWSVTETDDGKKIGHCTMNKIMNFNFSLDKWQMFMRWNDEIDGSNYKKSPEARSNTEFSVPGYIGISKAFGGGKVLERKNELSNDNDLFSMYGSGYVYDSNMNNAWGSSDEECNGSIDTATLISSYNLDSVAEDVNKAQNFFTSRQITSTVDTSIYFQKVENIHSINKDVFRSETRNYVSSGLAVKSTYVEFEYKHGYMYINFPGFKAAIDDPNTNFKYDDAITPKQIETLIEETISKKSSINEILMFDEENNGNYGTNGLIGMGNGVIGANCTEYLTAALGDIQVKLTDCFGEYIATTNYKDYIIGVTRAEIGYTNNDNYALTQMVAAISYSLNRRNNYANGTTINMRGGTCDQVWCDPFSKCYGKATGATGSGTVLHSYYPTQVPGTTLYKNELTNEQYARYSALYDKASNYLVIGNGSDKIYATGYVSTVQNRWETKANSGYDFSKIIEEEYSDATLVNCKGNTGDVYGGVVNNDYSTNAQTNFGTSTAYPKSTPNKGNFYGFPYNDGPAGRDINIDPRWVSANIITISSNCSEGSWNKSYRVNIAAKSNFEQAFASICKLLTTGINGVKLNASDLQRGGTFVERLTSQGSPSLHGYGLAQDWNYSTKYTINGKTYDPYNRDINEYYAFINALGKEDDPRNINYMLWKYAYQPAGFTWGGNWGRNGNSGVYDGMHFEIDWRASV